MLRLDQSYISKFFNFCGRVGGGGVENWRLKLTSAKVEVEVEAELGKIFPPYCSFMFPFYSQSNFLFVYFQKIKLNKLSFINNLSQFYNL